MKIQKPLFIIAPLALSFLLSNTLSLAQMQQMPQQMPSSNQMAMILYPLERGADGRQYITTQAGYKISIPGLGIAPTASQIAVYRDPQNNFWYIDKTGNPTAVSGEQMQNVMSQIQRQSMQRGQVQYGQYPQGMPMQNMPPQNMYGQAVAPAATAAPAAAATTPTQTQQSSNSKSNNGSSAMVTGLAAAGGAAVGSMLMDSMYDNNNSSYGGVPYGAPVYREADGRYYYGDGAGKHVYVVPNSTNASTFDQYAKQGNWQDKQQWSQPASTTANMQSNASQAQSTQAQKDEQKAQDSSKRRRRFRNQDSEGSTQSGQGSSDNNGGRLGRRFR